MSLTSFSLKRPVTVTMIFLSVLVIGLISSQLLPLEFFPAFNAPVVGVWVPYHGTTPETVESDITSIIEEAVSTISGIETVRSWSFDDGANLDIRFKWEEDIDINVKAIKVREKIDGVRHLLPDDLDNFYIFKFSTQDMPIMHIRLSSKKDLSKAYQLIEKNIKKKLERIEGVSKVEIYGVSKRDIEINLDTDRLIAHGVDIYELYQTLSRANFSITAGSIKENDTEFLVRPIGELSSLEEYQNIVLNDRGIKLKDVADVSFVFPEMNHGRHLDRKFAIGLSVQKSSGANTIRVTDKILDEIEKIKKIPEMEGISIFLMENQAAGIKTSLWELMKSGIIGACFATFILFFFLRSFSTTVIVVLAVPLSLLTTATFMYFTGISLNILSMSGLLLAIGMLVDNSVVAIESIHKQKAIEKDPKRAVLIGVDKISLAITAGTLTSIIIFLPNIIAPATMISIWLKHVGVPLVIALVASLIISKTIIPMLASVIKGGSKLNGDRTILSRFLRFYHKRLKWNLDHHGWAVLIMFGVLFSVMVPANLVKSDAFPDTEKRELNLYYNLHSHYTVEKSEEAVNIIEEYLYSRKEEFEIKSVYSFYSTWNVQTKIILYDDDRAEKSPKEIEKLILEDLPQLSIGRPAFEWSRSSGGDSNVKIYLSGRSFEKLTELSKDIIPALERVEGIADVKSDAESGENEIIVSFDRERLKSYGLSASTVASIISTSIRGSRMKNFRTDNGEVEVYLKFDDEDRTDSEKLKKIPIHLPSGDIVMLENIARFTGGVSPSRIQKRDKVISLGIVMNLKGITMDDAKKYIRATMDNYTMPTGYKWSYGLSFSEDEEALQSMKENMILAILLIYFVMAALFESFVFPLAIWISIIFAIIGVYWSFLLTGTTMSVMAWIGVLILIGVVVNNGIVLIDRITALRSEGVARYDAILQAGKDRFRPILMTASTTILSMLPLCLVNTQIGGDGPPYYPMARAIVGGLAFSTMITLMILPTLYILLDDVREWLTKVFKKGLR